MSRGDSTSSRLASPVTSCRSNVATRLRRSSARRLCNCADARVHLREPQHGYHWLLRSDEFAAVHVVDGSIAGLHGRRLAGFTIYKTGLPESGYSPPVPCAAEPLVAVGATGHECHQAIEFEFNRRLSGNDYTVLESTNVGRTSRPTTRAAGRELAASLHGFRPLGTGGCIRRVARCGPSARRRPDGRC